MRAKDVTADRTTVYAWAVPHTYGTVLPVVVHDTGLNFRTRKVQKGIGLGDTTGRKERSDGAAIEVIAVEGKHYPGSYEPGHRETVSVRELTGTWAEYEAAQAAKREQAQHQQAERERRMAEQQKKRQHAQQLAERMTRAGIAASADNSGKIVIYPQSFDALDALLQVHA
jgi:hypothetical protein